MPRPVPTMTIAPQAIQKFTLPGQYQDNLQQTAQLGSTALANAQAAAVQRKVAAQALQQQQQQDALAAAQAHIDAKIKASQQKTQQYQQTATNTYGTIARQKQKIGASQTTQANSAFRGNANGQLTAVGPMGKKAAAIINEALKYRGMPYQWGGASPKTSFDCSGLVQWAYKSVGINLPRVSADQARDGRKIPLSMLRPGDLVAWDENGRNLGADHIAIYIGNGQVIEAPHTGADIRVRALGSAQQNSNAWGVEILR
jgi:cell wall-associated NlpC family hydrolase